MLTKFKKATQNTILFSGKDNEDEGTLNASRFAPKGLTYGGFLNEETRTRGEIADDVLGLLESIRCEGYLRIKGEKAFTL